MRCACVMICLAGLTSLASGQTPNSTAKAGNNQPSTIATVADSRLKDFFESKIKAEWDAIKNKDKAAYGELLADDYQGVEVDGKGERNKIQAINEMPAQNVANYTLWGMKLIPIAPDAAFIIYESTMQFPPKSAVRYSRVYITELWMKRAGQWKEVHYQETHVK